jgi:uncharacterized membrane protein HdeD (DUF308 family)
MSGSSTPTTATTAAAQGRFATARQMARHWWVFALRGVASVLFGLVAFLVPGLGLVAILAVLGAWMAVDGVATLYQAVRGGGGGTQARAGGAAANRGRGWLWLDGLLSLAAAAVILLMPGLSALALVLVTGAWLIAVGVIRVVLAFRMGSALLGLLGALTAGIGLWLVIAPGPGLLALIWMVAIQAVVAGALLIGLAWRLRRIHHDPHGPAATDPQARAAAPG